MAPGEPRCVEILLYYKNERSEKFHWSIMPLLRSSHPAELLSEMQQSGRRCINDCDMETPLVTAVLPGCQSMPWGWKYISWGESFVMIHGIFWCLPLTWGFSFLLCGLACVTNPLWVVIIILRGVSVWGFPCSSCERGDSTCTAPNMLACLSNLNLNWCKYMSKWGLYMFPFLIVWKNVQGVPGLLPSGSWDRLKSLCHLCLDYQEGEKERRKQGRRMNGWMVA